MSKKEPVILPGDAAPALYSPAVRIEHTLYVSGQVGEDTQGCVPDGIEAQTALAIENAAKLINAEGRFNVQVLSAKERGFCWHERSIQPVFRRRKKYRSRPVYSHSTTSG